MEISQLQMDILRKKNNFFLFLNSLGIDIRNQYLFLLNFTKCVIVSQILICVRECERLIRREGGPVIREEWPKALVTSFLARKFKMPL